MYMYMYIYLYLHLYLYLSNNQSIYPSIHQSLSYMYIYIYVSTNYLKYLDHSSTQARRSTASSPVMGLMMLPCSAWRSDLLSMIYRWVTLTTIQLSKNHQCMFLIVPIYLMSIDIVTRVEKRTTIYSLFISITYSVSNHWHATGRSPRHVPDISLAID